MPKTKTTVTETTDYKYRVVGNRYELVQKTKTTVTESEYPNPYANTFTVNAQTLAETATAAITDLTKNAPA